MGFRAPLEASGIVRQWLRGEHRSLNGEVARSHLMTLLPVLLEQLGRTDNPNATLVLFDHFLGNLHGAARLLSLLQQKPDLIALTALVLGAAPLAADWLAGVLDAGWDQPAMRLATGALFVTATLVSVTAELVTTPRADEVAR